MSEHLPSGFSFERLPYPNGTFFVRISYGKCRLGTCAEGPSGFVVFGKRTPVATLALAARQMLRDAMTKCYRDEALFEEAAELLKP